MDDLLRNERDDRLDRRHSRRNRSDARIGARTPVPEASAWIGSTGFSAKPGSTCLVPGRRGKLASVLVGVGAGDDPWALAGVPDAVPAGPYHLDLKWSSRRLERAALGWALAAYRFERYKKAAPPAALLFPGSAAAADSARVLARAVARVRDLINTPACDMMPKDLAAAGVGAGEHARCGPPGGDRRSTAGRTLPRDPRGRTGERPPSPPHRSDLGRFAYAPRLTLVGKGVCFDSGGLDIKPASGMRLMKKDMGGAAHAIGLADLVMSTGTTGAAAAARAGGGERDRRQRLSARRRDLDPQGSDRRGRQHRRGGAGSCCATRWPKEPGTSPM